MENTKALEIAREITKSCIELHPTQIGSPCSATVNTAKIAELVGRVIGDLRAQLAEARTECEEQARLNGMGSEREARLMAQLAERDAQLAAVDGFIRDARGHYMHRNVNQGHAFLTKALDAIATRQPTQDKGGER